MFEKQGSGWITKDRKTYGILPKLIAYPICQLLLLLVSHTSFLVQKSPQRKEDKGAEWLKKVSTLDLCKLLKAFQCSVTHKDWFTCICRLMAVRIQ